MSCPKCHNYNIVRRGYYYLQRIKGNEQRFYCKDCNHYFVPRFGNFRLKIPLQIRNMIIELWNKNKGYIRKFDPMRKNTYSSREIAKMMNVSPTFVLKIINEKN